MLNHGASFKEVADVLGHRSLQTTGIYAKLELDIWFCRKFSLEVMCGLLSP